MQQHMQKFVAVCDFFRLDALCQLAPDFGRELVILTRNNPWPRLMSSSENTEFSLGRAAEAIAEAYARLDAFADVHQDTIERLHDAMVILKHRSFEIEPVLRQANAGDITPASDHSEDPVNGLQGHS